MAGVRIPGSMGIDLLHFVDGGTLPVIPMDLPGPVRRVVAQARAVGRVVSTAYTTTTQALAALKELSDDIDEQLRFIASLPESIRKRVAEEFFASYFDQPLPKRFIHHYVWSNGATYGLTEREMIDCNPYINLGNSDAFEAALLAARAKPGVAVPLKMGVLAGALTNGTLGQFTVKLDGNLVAQADGRWVAKGTMQFYDEWDFDPKDWKTGGRSTAGELKTRIAYYGLPGKGFKITSPSVDFEQTEADGTVKWKGGKPKVALDRVSQLDLELKGGGSK